jgi:ribonuclease T1
VKSRRVSAGAVLVATLLAVAAVLAVLWPQADETSSGNDVTAVTVSQESTTDLPIVTLSELPPEAIDTLMLIGSQGPYPFSRDGVVFNNREGLLPPQPRGFYREYTVITPGVDNRGARRIVTGNDGARFYTNDHYDSFQEIVDQ